MKKIALLFLAAILSMSCNSQENKKDGAEQKNEKNELTERPKGTWKVDKEFDENGNLIRYDSIYSWSSADAFEDLNLQDRDSLLQSFQSKFFRRFSGSDRFGFNPFFEQDSLFGQRFFNEDFFGSDFGKDFMDIDKMHERMQRMEKEFFERHKARFIEPEAEKKEGQM